VVLFGRHGTLDESLEGWRDFLGASKLEFEGKAAEGSSYA
jgi:hypothetical protein